jgi:hypothetical protein
LGPGYGRLRLPAGLSFICAHSYVRPLSDLERDRYYAEGTLAASLYGASAPTSEAALEMRFEAMANQLERSDILFEFLAIMRAAPILPLPLRPVQPLLIWAAIDLTPHWLRAIVGLTNQGLTVLGAAAAPILAVQIGLSFEQQPLMPQAQMKSDDFPCFAGRAMALGIGKPIRNAGGAINARQKVTRAA